MRQGVGKATGRRNRWRAERKNRKLSIRNRKRAERKGSKRKGKKEEATGNRGRKPKRTERSEGSEPEETKVSGERGRKGIGRAEVVICRGETAEGEKRLQMKLLTFSCVSLEGAKASQTTAKWVVEYAPLAQLVEQLTLNQWVPGSSP